MIAASRMQKLLYTTEKLCALAHVIIEALRASASSEGDGSGEGDLSRQVTVTVEAQGSAGTVGFYGICRRFTG